MVVVDRTDCLLQTLDRTTATKVDCLPVAVPVVVD
jgi:hypothetical protein